MGKYSLYKIALRPLSDGKHEFSYHLDNKFFELINDNEADVKKGDVDVMLAVKRLGSTFDFNFDINGYVLVPCDRCLDNIRMEINTKNKLIVKFGAEYAEESDEIVVIPEEEGEINISWFLYEFIVLSLPMKKVHPSGECNKAMTSKLKKYKTTSEDSDDDDFDEDSDDDFGDSDEPITDSRWDTLKNINLDDN